MQQHMNNRQQAGRLGGLSNAGRWTEQYEAEGKKDYLVLVVRPPSTVVGPPLRTGAPTAKHRTWIGLRRRRMTRNNVCFRKKIGTSALNAVSSSGKHRTVRIR